MDRHEKAALVLDALIFAFTIFATVTLIIGLDFMEDLRNLTGLNLKCFRYFTTDSNIFAAFVALVDIAFLISKKRSTVMYCFKLAAVTGLTLTMLVTVFFLAPRSKTTYLAYFMNSNFFMHLITPLLFIITFVFFDNSRKPPFKLTFTGIIPMAIYSLFYTPNIILHLDNGKIDPDYDWYGFLAGGLNTIWFVYPLIFFLTWIFSLGLWALNRKFSANN